MSNRYTITQNVLMEYIMDNGITSLDEFLLWIKSKVETIPKTEIKKKIEIEEKKKHLNFLLLKDSEYNELHKDYGDSIKKLMYELDTYIGSNGKHYQSHYYTLLNWIKRKGIKKIEIKEKIDYIEEKPIISEEAKDKIREQKEKFLSKLHI